MNLKKIAFETLLELTENKMEIAELACKLIKIPSISGQEAKLASVVKKLLIKNKFEQVELDDKGNVIAIIKGLGTGPSVMYNGHLDHVPPGKMSEPYTGIIMSGEKFGVKGDVVYGRGAVDMKGALAAMIYAGSFLLKNEITPPGDIIFTFAVEEEVGGIGSKYLVKNGVKGDVIIIAEPTNLNLALGHRGAAYSKINVHGKSAHVSMQRLGINALYKASTILEKIQKLDQILPEDPYLGKMEMVSCNMELVPGADNVIPEEAVITVSSRVTPGYTQEKLEKELNSLLESLAKQDKQFKAKVTTDRFKPAFITPTDNKFVIKAKKGLKRYLKLDLELTKWEASTDASFFNTFVDSTVIGFGPGNCDNAHTNKDYVLVDDLFKATAAYFLLPFMLVD